MSLVSILTSISSRTSSRAVSWFSCSALSLITSSAIFSMISSRVGELGFDFALFWRDMKKVRAQKLERFGFDVQFSLCVPLIRQSALSVMS